MAVFADESCSSGVVLAACGPLLLHPLLLLLGRRWQLLRICKDHKSILVVSLNDFQGLSPAAMTRSKLFW